MAEGQGFEPWEVLPSLVFKDDKRGFCAPLLTDCLAKTRITLVFLCCLRRRLVGMCKIF